MELRKKLEKAHYNGQARNINFENYDWRSGSKRFNIALRSPYEFCEKWLTQHCKSKKILDYGCGHGIHSILPAKWGGVVIGVDISIKSIKIAKERAIIEGVSDYVTFKVGDCESLDFPDNYFDIVFSSGTLSCLDLAKAYFEMARVLKPDGKALIVDTLGYNPLLNFTRWIRYKLAQRTKQTIENILRMNDIYLALKYFDKIKKLKFFDFTTLAISPFVKKDNTCMHVIISFAKKIDDILLKLPFLKYLAFKVVYVLSQPNKS